MDCEEWRWNDVYKHGNVIVRALQQMESAVAAPILAGVGAEGAAFIMSTMEGVAMARILEVMDPAAAADRYVWLEEEYRKYSRGEGKVTRLLEEMDAAAAARILGEVERLVDHPAPPLSLQESSLHTDASLLELAGEDTARNIVSRLDLGPARNVLKAAQSRLPSWHDIKISAALDALCGDEEEAMPDAPTIAENFVAVSKILRGLKEVEADGEEGRCRKQRRLF